MSLPGKTKFQIDLRRHLRENGVNDNLTHLICEIAEASKYIIHSIRTGDLGVAGTSNLYGEQQLALDVLADRILRKRLDHSRVVANMMSEVLPRVPVLRGSRRDSGELPHRLAAARRHGRPQGP